MARELILGIDPGLAIVGWGIIDKTNSSFFPVKELYIFIHIPPYNYFLSS